MSFRWERNSGQSESLYYGKECIGELVVRPSDGILPGRRQMEEIEPGIFQIVQSFSVTEKGDLIPVAIDFIALFPSEWTMIPAVSYNGNHWGNGREPKGFEKDGVPWTFSYSRCSVPGATFSTGKRWSVGLFGKMDSSVPAFSCSLIPKEGKTVHRLIWPEQEAPLSYCGTDRYKEPFRRSLDVEKGTDFTAVFYLILDERRDGPVPYSKMMDFAWKLFYHEQKPWFSPKELWNLGRDYAKNVLYVEDRKFRGFSKGLKWNGTEWNLRPSAKYLVGWTGQNLSLANSMLYHFARTGDKNDYQMAIHTLDSWVNHATLENGLIRCLFDFVLGDETGKEVQDACNLSDAALNFLEAWEFLRKLHINKPEYRKAAMGICDFAVCHQLPSGSFGKSWTNDGEVWNSYGTIGCCLVVPLIKAYELTKESKYRNSAKKGYAFYLDCFQKDGYTTAAALDTCCIDKESAISLLKSSLLLYELERDEKYLKYAEWISCYLSTWQWHYTDVFPSATPLSDMHYDTFGGASVSTQHHHMDAFALCFVEDWLKLSRFTGKDIWRQRARAAWINGTFGISDGTLEVSGIKRPAGSQDEGFFHTHWGTSNEASQSPKGYVSNWLVAWPTAFRLQTLRHLEDWEPLQG